MKNLHKIEIPNKQKEPWYKYWLKDDWDLKFPEQWTYKPPNYYATTRVATVTNVGTTAAAATDYFYPIGTDWGLKADATIQTTTATCHVCGTTLAGILPRGKRHMAIQHVSRDNHRYNYT
jgi:hypothetical protein